MSFNAFGSFVLTYSPTLLQRDAKRAQPYNIAARSKAGLLHPELLPIVQISMS